MGTTADLYTTVVNKAGRTVTYSYLGKHGKTLAADGEYTVWGHIQHSFGHGEIAVRKKKALERDVVAGKLVLKSTPKPVYYNKAEALDKSVATATVARSGYTVTVTCATSHNLIKLQYASTLKALASNIAKITVGANHGIKAGDRIKVVLGTPDPVFDGAQTVTAVDATSVYYAKTNADVNSAAGVGVVYLLSRYVKLAGLTAATEVATVESFNGTWEVLDVTSASAFTFTHTATGTLSPAVVTTAGTMTPDQTPNPVAAISGNGNTATVATTGFPGKTFGFAITYVNKYGETLIGTSPVAVDVTSGKAVALTLPIFPAGCTANIYMTTEYTNGSAYTADAPAASPAKWKAIATGVPNNTNPLATSNVVTVTKYSYYDAATFAASTMTPPTTSTATDPSVTYTLGAMKDGSLGTVDLSWGKVSSSLGA